MDTKKFDGLSKAIGTATSRRSLVVGVAGGGIAALLAATAHGDVAARRGQAEKKRRTQRHQTSQRVHAQAETCWRAGACIPSTGSNVSRCDLAGSTAFKNLNCTRCNVSGANLRGVNLSGADLTRANLSGSCLVDANLTGATINPTNTNIYNAVLCRTIMPNGDINNSGCGSGTACCPTSYSGPSGPCVVGVGVTQTATTVTGTTADDTIDCTNASPGKTITGGDGNDTITGTQFGDSIDGGNGNDTISGGPGDDVIEGGNGNDTLTGGPGNDLVTDVGDGNDTITP
jgi:Pentapeptide repeats (8 copies)/RTX calcium-binding nonapeptide repeat (4 copies)